MKLRVRIAEKKGASRFFRCGMAFSPEWLEVEVDAATADALRAEQMLEVADVQGGKPPVQAADGALPAGDSADAKAPSAAPAPVAPAPAVAAKPKQPVV